MSEAIAGTSTEGIQTDVTYWHPPTSLVFVGSNGKHYRLDEDGIGDSFAGMPDKEKALVMALLAHAQAQLMPQRWITGLDSQPVPISR